MAEEEIQLWQTVKPVEFVPRISERNKAQALLISTRQGDGYHVAAGQLAHAIRSRATHILMDYSQNACAMRYQIDGNWEQLPPIDRETGDAMLYALKQLSLMNPSDRRTSQTGECGLKVGKNKFTLTVQSQGVSSGERVLARLESEDIPFETMTDLGMRDKMLEAFKAKLNSSGNIVLISVPKGEGLTTTWITAMNTADRFIRDFQLFKDHTNKEPEIINVSENTFGGDAGIPEQELVAKVILKEPDVLMFPDLPTPESMKQAVEQVDKEGKQIYMRINANSALHAVTQLMARYRDCAREISQHVGAVLGQKLVRRLCDNCKDGFEPTPQLLKQLGIPAGRVAMLYKPFIPPPIEQQVDERGRPAPIEPCHVCEGRGYYGRIAVFELLEPGDQLRAALMKTQDQSQLAKIAKSEGHRGLQAEGVLAVARGLTSLDELKRVFAKKK